MTRLVVAVLALLLSACPTPEPRASSHSGALEGEEETVTQTYAARGLYTFPNNLSEVPDGAFSRADNAVIRRDGIIETRRGFQPLATGFGASGDRLNVLSDFSGTLVGHTTASKVVRYSGGSWAEYAGTYAPPSGRRTRFLQSAKSLYFTTTGGVKRVDEVTGNVYDAGVPQAPGGAVALNSNGAHAVGAVTLAGGAGNVTVVVGGTSVGPVTFVTSDTVTAAAVVTALNANATIAALVTATSVGPVITLTAKQGGTVGNTITLTASRSAGTATASGATLTGGNDGSGWFPAGAQVAYRFVWGIRNANDRIILGAPSGRLALTNPATETVDTVTVTVQVPDWVTTEHFLQVYRADFSASASIPASDDMSLAYEVYPSAQNISTGSISFTDVTPDELKGAALYSSPNIGVPGSEKFQPPVCTDLAEYKGRVWCSATTQRQRILLTLLSVDSTSGGLDNGQGLKFTAANGSQVTFSGQFIENSATQSFKIYTDGTASMNVEQTAQSLVRVINTQTPGFLSAAYVSGEYDSPGQVLVEARDLGVGSIAVDATVNAAPWLPALPITYSASSAFRTSGVVTVVVMSGHNLEVGDMVNLLDVYTVPSDEAKFPSGVKVVTAVPSSTQFQYAEAGADDNLAGTLFFRDGTSITTDPEDAPNGIAYAEYGEGVDAVPLSNYITAGAANYPIQRIIPLGDTLFIFKDEGVYILTGDTPDTFSIRAFPTPAKIVAASTAVILGNAIYVLTDQGVMAFSESGAQLISRPIEGTLATFYAGDSNLRATTASVAFAVGYETEREYHLFLPSTASDTYATQAYVYNYVTRAWTRWTVPATTGHVLPSDGLEYFGDPSASSARVERKTRTTSDYQDATGVAISAAMDWQVRTENDPSGYKHWKKVTVMLEQPTAPSTVTLGLQTEMSSRVEGPFSTNGLPYVSTYVPVDQSRSQTLTVGASGGEVGKVLALKGLSVDTIISSTKLR